MALLGSIDGRRSDSIAPLIKEAADQSMSAKHVLVRVEVNLLKKNGSIFTFCPWSHLAPRITQKQERK